MKKLSWKLLPVLLIGSLLLGAGNNTGSGCSQEPTSNDIQRDQQDTLLQQATSQVGMPAIKNFRERKMLKDIYELRDQDGLITYTYLFSEQTGKVIFLCNSIGYGIPAATQFTAPETMQHYYVKGTGAGDSFGTEKLHQADPNGLFSPESADGTWVLCADPKNKSKDTQPVWIEPRIIVSPFKLD